MSFVRIFSLLSSYLVFTGNFLSSRNYVFFRQLQNALSNVLGTKCYRFFVMINMLSSSFLENFVGRFTLFKMKGTVNSLFYNEHRLHMEFSNTHLPGSSMSAIQSYTMTADRTIDDTRQVCMELCPQCKI